MNTVRNGIWPQWEPFTNFFLSQPEPKNRILTVLGYNGCKSCYGHSAPDDSCRRGSARVRRPSERITDPIHGDWGRRSGSVGPTQSYAGRGLDYFGGA